MYVFIDFWKLETKNSILHVFSFLHKLSFENSFYFLPILSCQTSFLVSKIENCFWKQKIRGKNSYQTYPYLSLQPTKKNNDKVMNFFILCYSFLFCSFKMGSWKEGIQDIRSQFNLISGKPSCFLSL